MDETSRGRVIVGAFETFADMEGLISKALTGQCFGNSPAVLVVPASQLGVRVAYLMTRGSDIRAKCMTWSLTAAVESLWQHVQDAAEALSYSITNDILFLAADTNRANAMLRYFIARNEIKNQVLVPGSFIRMKRRPDRTKEIPPHISVSE